MVDDSKLVRAILTEILNSDPEIKVVDTAEDPFDAREKIKKHNPDVITLDIEMPKMDGIEFLKKIMKLRPMPVVMVSTLTAKGADITLEALKIGAIDFVHKPGHKAKDIESLAQDLIEKVKIAANANLKAKDVVPVKSKIPGKVRKASIIAIGASTGGTETIKDALTGYSAEGPPVVISQHIPPIFSSTYAQRLQRDIGIKVTEITNKTKLVNGEIYLAQGGAHMLFSKSDAVYAYPDFGEKINKHRPSVDVMFNGLIPIYGSEILAILLTGMGSDGAKGMLNIQRTGAHTIAQDEETSVVWGMPRQAALIGAAKEVLSLGEINQCLKCVKVIKK